MCWGPTAARWWSPATRSTTATAATTTRSPLKTATGTITPAALTITATTDSKVYDGTTSLDGDPNDRRRSTTATRVTGLTQAFGSKDVLGADGSTLAVTGYTVNDGNGGNDYTVTWSRRPARSRRRR